MSNKRDKPYVSSPVISSQFLSQWERTEHIWYAVPHVNKIMDRF